ncbi:hypothetical protein F4801DRAFT_581089 [Xylaria longipes]|nr:hypothetical protein F4801DRAFT_581089 [Xylaria longipes]
MGLGFDVCKILGRKSLDESPRSVLKLERFFENPRAFRTELGRAVSGSFALQFFANKYWPESDLDINVRDGKSVDRLGEYLTQTEGYQLASDQEIERYKYAKPRILTYTKHTGGGDSPLLAATKCKVQLIATKNQPVQAILNGYYTSCIMNFISWNKAYCIFTRAALLFGETVTLTGPQHNNVELQRKYSRRGWRLRTAPVFPDQYQEAFAAYKQKKQSKDKTYYQGCIFPFGTGVLSDKPVGWDYWDDWLPEALDVFRDDSGSLKREGILVPQ